MINQLINLLNTTLGSQFHIFDNNNEKKSSRAKFQGVLRRTNTVNSSTSDKITMLVEQFVIEFVVPLTLTTDVRTLLDQMVSSTQSYEYNDESVSKRFILNWDSANEPGQVFVQYCEDCSTLILTGSIVVTDSFLSSNGLVVKISETQGGTYSQLKGIVKTSIATSVALTNKATVGSSVDVLESGRYSRPVQINGFLLNDGVHQILTRLVNNPQTAKNRLFFQFKLGTLFDFSVAGYVDIQYDFITNNFITFALTIRESG